MNDNISARTSRLWGNIFIKKHCVEMNIILQALLSLDICLAFISRNIRSTGIESSTIYDDIKWNRGMDNVMDKKNKDRSIHLSSKSIDLPNSLQISFMDKLSGLNDEKEFVSFLKSSSQKRISLSSSDRQRLAGELIYRGDLCHMIFR